MPCLGNENGVDGGVGQRDGLGGARQDTDLGKHPGELGAHLLKWLDSDHVQPAGHELAGELAGTGTQVENPTGARREHEVHGLGGVARTAPLVRRGR